VFGRGVGVGYQKEKGFLRVKIQVDGLVVPIGAFEMDVHFSVVARAYVGNGRVVGRQIFYGTLCGDYRQKTRIGFVECFFPRAGLIFRFLHLFRCLGLFNCTTSFCFGRLFSFGFLFFG